MTDAIKEESKDLKDNSLYQDFRKALLNIEKAVPLKDTKTLSNYSKLLNKFRRGFNDEDVQYICDNFIKHKYSFSFTPSLEVHNKVK